jgi:hypothetical protein
LPSLETGLAWVFVQLVFATMMAIVMVVDFDDAFFGVVFVVAVCEFFFT